MSASSRWVSKRAAAKSNERLQVKEAATLRTFDAMVSTQISLGTQMIEREGDQARFAVKPSRVIVTDWFDRRLFLPKEVDGNSGPRDLFIAWLYKLNMFQMLIFYLFVASLTARILVEAGFLGMENILLAGGVILVVLLSLHLTGFLFPQEAEAAENCDWMVPAMTKWSKRFALLGDHAVYISSPSVADDKFKEVGSTTSLREVGYSDIGRIERMLRQDVDGDANIHETIVYDKAGVELFRVDRKNSLTGDGDNAIHFLKTKLQDHAKQRQTFRKDEK